MHHYNEQEEKTDKNKAGMWRRAGEYCRAGTRFAPVRRIYGRGAPALRFFTVPIPPKKMRIWRACTANAPYWPGPGEEQYGEKGEEIRGQRASPAGPCWLQYPESCPEFNRRPCPRHRASPIPARTQHRWLLSSFGLCMDVAGNCRSFSGKSLRFLVRVSPRRILYQCLGLEREKGGFKTVWLIFNSVGE